MTTDTITWQNTNTALTPQQASIGGTGLTGSFLAAGLGGTTVTINNLNRADEPVFDPSAPFSPPLPAQQFITFNSPSAALFPALNITEVFNGLFSSAACLSAPAPGQLCTPGPPVTPNPSPFSFVNDAVGQSTASFTFSGVTSDGLSNWTVVFSTQFGTPFQTVLAAFAAGGSGTVTNTYSATFTLTPTAGVPEPGTVALMGLGLGLVVLSAGLRRRFTRR